MTNEQCIEIAERVWGLKTDTRGNHETLWRDPEQTLINLEELLELVNSWSGFGITVGFLHERKLPKRLTDRYKALYIDFLRGHLTAEIFIQGTHLVALEANLKGEQGGKTKTGAGAIRKGNGNAEAGGLDKGGCRV